jgi:hypothetical protein
LIVLLIFHDAKKWSTWLKLSSINLNKHEFKKNKNFKLKPNSEHFKRWSCCICHIMTYVDLKYVQHFFTLSKFWEFICYLICTQLRNALSLTCLLKLRIINNKYVDPYTSWNNNKIKYVFLVLILLHLTWRVFSFYLLITQTSKIVITELSQLLYTWKGFRCIQ